MKAVVVASNREKNPFPVIPIGACMVAELCAKQGIDVQFVDMVFSDNPLDELRRELDANPDFVAVSFRNLNNHDASAPVSHVSFLKSIATIVKQRGIVLYIGGAACAVAPDEIYGLTGANALFAGHANEFARRLAGGEIIKGVVKDNSAEPFVNADLERWIDMDRYLSYERAVPVRLKSGCPYKCSYCTYPLIEGAPREKEISAGLMSYLRKWIERGVGVDIVDSIFNEPEEWAADILETLIECGLKGSYHISAFSPLISSHRILDSMTRLGAKAGMIGIDSASDTMLKAYRKPFRMKDITRFMELRKGYDLRFLWTFILGGPGETEKTLDESLAFIEALPPTDVAYIVTGVRVYKGTYLYEQALGEGVIGKDDDLLEPVFYFSKSLDKDYAQWRIDNWQAACDNALIDSVASSDDYINAIKQLSELGVGGAGWESVPMVKKLLRRRREHRRERESTDSV